MIFKCLDGREIKVTLSNHKNPLKPLEYCKSVLQWEVGQEIQKALPRHVILEEFIVPGSRLSCDFFVPSLMIVVEADGGQHDRYVRHFHGDHRGFARAQARDKEKARWCDLNGIMLIRVKRSQDVRNAIRDSLAR